MATVELCQPAAFTINYMGGVGTLTLIPGVNVNVPDEEWALARKHPVVKLYQEEGLLHELNYEPGAKGELGGLDVTDTKRNDQPVPVSEPIVGNVAPEVKSKVRKFADENKGKEG